jgi:hypothetical protein
VPRLSSPLDAKASIRSPYALDRSQQNSCVGTVCGPAVRKPVHAHTCALNRLLSQTMMSSRVHPKSTRGRRINPSIHDVILPSQTEVQLGNLISTIALPSRANGLRMYWWSQTGSNRRPHACKARALPTELWPLKTGVPRASQRELSSDPVRPRCHTMCGGPRQTRTADLTLIRRVL